MLKKSPVLTPSLENLSYILRHREWWPDGFKWNYHLVNCCAIGLCSQLWGYGPESLHPGFRDSKFSFETSRAFNRIFYSRVGKTAWYKLPLLWKYEHHMRSITPEQVADQIDRFLAKHHG